MPKIHITTPAGDLVVVEGRAGESVMVAAVRNGVTGVVGQCGGSLSCATCHVYVDPRHEGAFGTVSDDEDEMLDCTASDREETSRLSCQLLLADEDVHVELPEEQL